MQEEESNVDFDLLKYLRTRLYMSKDNLQKGHSRKSTNDDKCW